MNIRPLIVGNTIAFYSVLLRRGEKNNIMPLIFFNKCILSCPVHSPFAEGYIEELNTKNIWKLQNARL